LNERHDKAYTMLSMESVNDITFIDFKKKMSDYVSKINSYEVDRYYTQQFKDHVNLTIIYSYTGDDDVKSETLKEEWKLIREEEKWKIVF